MRSGPACACLDDALTGLANRRALDAALTDWVTSRPHAFACALIDVDHFKRVNDRWSHQVGDQVLARLAMILLGALRASDQAARYGGEEFVLLLDGGLTISIGVAHHRADEVVAPTDVPARPTYARTASG